MASFRDDYQPVEGDICVRRLREDRFEVCVYDSTKAEWHDQTKLSLAEINKLVRSQPFLGKWDEWEYYRPRQ